MKASEIIENLKANVEQIAKDENMKPIDVVTLLQAGAALTKDETLLEALIALKWDYIR